MNEPTLERHFHWEFFAFDHDGPVTEGVKIHWGATVTVIGYLCEADAKIAAQDILPRQHCKLQRVWECPACGYQTKVAETMDKMAEALK